MADFKSWSELEKYINQQASKILKSSVAETVREEISDTIKEVEYPLYVSDAKEPYIRQMDDGGLSDVRNMEVSVIDDNTIAIENVRMDGTRDVATIFALGIGYSWKNSAIYHMQPFPRNFYEDTVERLNKNNKHVDAFKSGMAQLGFKIL